MNVRVLPVINQLKHKNYKKLATKKNAAAFILRDVIVKAIWIIKKLYFTNLSGQSQDCMCEITTFQLLLTF